MAWYLKDCTNHDWHRYNDQNRIIVQVRIDRIQYHRSLLGFGGGATSASTEDLTLSPWWISLGIQLKYLNPG